VSSYGGWRNFKIVEPVSRAQEISGGIKNALDRGEPLMKAKQSFINAGYTPQEVQAATQMVRQTSSGTARPVNALPSIQSQPSTSKDNKSKKTISKKTIIILAIIGVIILAIALGLGLFWDKLF